MSWAEQGNVHLLRYVGRRGGATPQATRVLVAHKNAWVRDMVDGKGVDMQTGEVLSYSIAEMKSAWNDCMQRAEAEIVRLGEPQQAAA